MTVEIAASPEEVWAALTEADRLVQWFPLEASVRPGVGGETRWSWRGEWSWRSVIDRWEPGSALRLVNHEQRPFDADGREMPAGSVAPATLVMDFTLEAAGGSTVLRLVHSGFGRGTAWDDELDGVSIGWQFELRSLKFYLERHRGRRRRAGLATVTTAQSHGQVWARLLGPGGFTIVPWPPAPGSRHRIESPGGAALTGDLFFAVADREFSAVVDELGAGLFRIGTHRAAGRTGVTIWHASYSADQGYIDELTGHAQALLDRLFGSGASA